MMRIMHYTTISLLLHPDQRYLSPMIVQSVAEPMTEMCFGLRTVSISRWSWNTTHHMWCGLVWHQHMWLVPVFLWTY